MALKVGMVSLGCSKNRVDSEVLLGILRDNGYEIVPDPAEADAVEWIAADELERQLTLSPEKFTPWFITAAPIALEFLKK